MAYLSDGEWYVVREGDSVLISKVAYGETVRMPLDVFDAVVMMRWGQLNWSEHPAAVSAATHRAIDFGTLGGEELRRMMRVPPLMPGVDG